VRADVCVCVCVCAHARVQSECEHVRSHKGGQTGRVCMVVGVGTQGRLILIWTDAALTLI
jgi:hypothetical protein